jgi:hypothetical protein
VRVIVEEQEKEENEIGEESEKNKEVEEKEGRKKLMQN